MMDSTHSLLYIQPIAALVLNSNLFPLSMTVIKPPLKPFVWGAFIIHLGIAL